MIFCHTFLVTSAQEASLTSRNFPSCGDTGTGFASRFFSLSEPTAAADEDALAADEDVLAAAISGLHPPNTLLHIVAVLLPFHSPFLPTSTTLTHSTQKL